MHAMCYSARIKASIKELSWEFRAQPDMDSFEDIFRARLEDPTLKVPYGLDRYFVMSKEKAENKLAPLIQQHYAAERDRSQATLRETEVELKEVSKKTGVTAEKKKGVLERRRAKLLLKLDHELEKITPLDDRIYPFYAAPVIVNEGGQLKVKAMRYRARNLNGSEVPPQYNVFNARRDSLLEARTWKPLLGKHHAVFPFFRFYEWVSRGGKKQEIYFSPDKGELMWAAALYAPGPKQSPFASFAMVTDEPPPEVAEAGHDRCPIYLAKAKWDEWLKPGNASKEELIALLGHQEKTHYNHGLAA